MSKFYELIAKNSNFVIDNLLKSIKLVNKCKNEMVFDYGSDGKDFYVIISGQVDVLVPIDKVIDIRIKDNDNEKDFL